MSTVKELIGLSVESPLVTPEAANFLPSRWPLPSDFPVCLDSSGNVVSTYGQPIWDVTPWAGKARKLNFGDGPPKGKAARISAENADVFRQIAAWWLWGPGAVRTASELVKRFEIFRPLFVFCTQQGICVTDLARFPRVVEQLPTVIRRSMFNYALSLLHDLLEASEFLGFVLLDSSSLRGLVGAAAKHEKAQTAYIPPRIWLYQLSRLRACLDDFLAHRKQLEDCYRFCLEAYATNAGSLAAACRLGLIHGREPFKKKRQHESGARSGCVFFGTFDETAKRFGLDGLFERWHGQPGDAPCATGIRSLSAYFTMIGQVGTAYLLNFSMMRVEECWALRSDCLSVERDSLDEDVYLLQGPTTKTIEDGDARWITSPSAKVAVDAMALVSRLRMIAAEANPDVPATPEDILNPNLVVRPYEPWVANAGDVTQPLHIRPVIQAYCSVVRLNPKLFDPEELRITQEDLEIALLLTPDLNPNRFAVGKVWPLAWHQLRRTGAVNMSASGVVSDASIQYQLKHATRAMSRYYGQGYYHLGVRLNEEARGEYIRAMYETIGREFAVLCTDRFVSPHGPKRKADILKLVSEKDHKGLVSSAKQGRLAYREHLLGGCTNPNPCDKGGIDSIAPCGGSGKPCEHLLYDRSKAPAYRKVRGLISARLIDSEPGSPLQSSLEAQLVAIKGAIDACEEA